MLLKSLKEPHCKERDAQFNWDDSESGKNSEETKNKHTEFKWAEVSKNFEANITIDSCIAHGKVRSINEWNCTTCKICNRSVYSSKCIF